MIESPKDRLVRAKVWNKSAGICWYCGKVMNPFEEFSVDHFIPKKRGGTDDLENLVPACRGCNSMKRDRSLEEFRRICSGVRRFSEGQLAVIRMVGAGDFEERLKHHAEGFRYWFEKQGGQK